MTVSTRRIIQLVIPMTGEQFLIFGVSLFDTAVTGSLGVEQISAQVIVVRWVQFTSVIYNIMSIGASILVAQAVGERNLDQADDILIGALTLAAISGIVLTVLALLIAPLLVSMMGVDPAVAHLSLPYLRLITLSFPFNFMLLSAAGSIRGAGDARTPLLVMIVANLCHVVTALTLVFGLELGLLGIALATVISRLSGLLLFLIVLIRGRGVLHLRRFRLRLAVMQQIWTLGSAVGGEQLALRLSQLVNLRLVTALGTELIAAYAVVSNSLSIILTIGLGFMSAAITMVGQLVGADAWDSVYGAGWRILRLGWLGMGGIGLIFFLWPQINGLFSANTGVLAVAALGLRLIVLAIPFETVNQVLTGVLRGSGDTRYPMLVSTFGQWVIRLPLMVLLINVIGLNGVWVAMIIEMAARSLLNLRRFTSRFVPESPAEMQAV